MPLKVEDNAFTVEMPGAFRTIELLNDKSARGTPFVLTIPTASKAGGYSYVAQTALYPGDVDVQPAAPHPSGGPRWPGAERLASGTWDRRPTGARPMPARPRWNRPARLTGWRQQLRLLAVLKERRFVFGFAFLGSERRRRRGRPLLPVAAS